MEALIRRAAAVQGAVQVPPDKAITQRAVLIAGLARGATELTPWSTANDCRRAADVMQALGVGIHSSSGSVRIDGLPGGGLGPARGELFCGESGTTFRLCAGILAGQPFQSTLSAGSLLRRRPMRRVVEPLSQMGARVRGVTSGAAEAGDAGEVFPPLTIEGHRPLHGITYRPAAASAQVKSAVLLAGLSARGRTTVVEPVPTRDHTERLLRHFNGAVHQDGTSVSVDGGGDLTSPGRLTIPGDFSSAAFLLVAAACTPGSRFEVRDVGLNPTRTAFLAVLTRMGGSIQTDMTEEAWEPRGTITVAARPLTGTTIEAREVPGLIDELPLLMVAACYAKGTTVFRGIGELRVKETDRIRSMQEGLTRLGAQLQLPEPDTLCITGAPLRGAAVDSFGDHRTAMALAVAGLAAEGETRLTGAECVSKSFPEFFELLRSAAGTACVSVPSPDQA